MRYPGTPTGILAPDPGFVYHFDKVFKPGWTQPRKVQRPTKKCLGAKCPGTKRVAVLHSSHEYLNLIKPRGKPKILPQFRKSHEHEF